MEKPGRRLLDQAIKVNVTWNEMRTPWTLVHEAPGRTQRHLGGIPAPSAQPWPILPKRRTNPGEETVPRVAGKTQQDWGTVTGSWGLKSPGGARDGVLALPKARNEKPGGICRKEVCGLIRSTAGGSVLGFANSPVVVSGVDVRGSRVRLPWKMVLFWHLFRKSTINSPKQPQVLAETAGLGPALGRAPHGGVPVSHPRGQSLAGRAHGKLSEQQEASVRLQRDEHFLLNFIFKSTARTIHKSVAAQKGPSCDFFFQMKCGEMGRPHRRKGGASRAI